MPFELRSHGEIPSLALESLAERGIRHGFTARPADFSGPGIDVWTGLFLNDAGASALLLPKQVHGDVVLDMSDPRILSEKYQGLCVLGEADAILFPVNREETGRLAFGIRTADCVPVILIGERLGAVVHAGWRGLANGIIQRVFERFGDGRLEAAIGPCAGGERYEVGDEVVEAIGQQAVYKPGPSGRFLLDTAGTAENILLECAGSRVKVEKSGICTISDRRFHSYRRDGDESGRSLAFVVI